MRVGVNLKFFNKDETDGYGYFTKEVFVSLAWQYPWHRFIFFFDRPFDTSIKFPENVEPVVINFKSRNALAFACWFSVNIPFALQKHHVDVLINPDGFCSLTTLVPQVLLLPHLAFKHYPKFVPKHQLWFNKIFIPKFLRKATVIITVSNYSKQDIVHQYKSKEQKVLVVGNAAKSIFKPIDWVERETIKEKFSGGCEYFIFIGAVHPRKNLMNLLKAFSLFKKWQKSNMKLLVTGKLSWQFKDIVERLKTFKYRDEVKMLGYLPEETLAKVLAAAYALVYPSYFEGFGLPILEAMQCEVPVLTSNVSSMPEVAGDAALYAHPSNAEEIAAQMKRIFKDEQLRNSLIEAGKVQAQKFTWTRTSTVMWSAIEQAVSK
jgi:glycosyltransferase involved in cell wall biosynthesis